MLQALRVQGFKSLNELARLDLPKLSILFGPNAAGKSNFLDAILAMSRVATSRTLGEALQEPIRGYPIEAFAFGPGGMPELVEKGAPEFTLEGWIGIGKEHKETYQYRVTVRIVPKSGTTSIADEYLASLTKRGDARGKPSIERVEGEIRIRRKSKPAHPRFENIGRNHTVLSDPRLGGAEYRAIERCREELSGWRVYYLDPRLAMRRAAPPADVRDIGVLGEDIAPFLYRLHAEEPKAFATTVRTLRSIIPSIDEVSVDLDKKRGTLGLQIRQNGIDYSSRIISEGTLRVLALCAVAVNPWAGTLIAFEEPENGVHPRRLELVAELLASMALEQGRQLVVTTHSPLFCAAMLRKSRERTKDEIGLFNVHRTSKGTAISRFEASGPLFDDAEIRKGLTADDEDAAFAALMERGILDE
jgi:predicted ATPase